jgi:CelD/BcsL family acetyltransferase involved in cellulose biosynthesis
VGEQGLLTLFAAWFSQADCADELVVSNVSARVSRVAGLLFSLQEKPAFANARLAEIGAAGVGTLLSRHARQHLHRSMRDFARYGALRVDEAQSTAEAFEFFGGLKVLHRRSWDRRRIPHAFRKPYFETFHRALIASGAPGTQMQLLRISAGNHVLGYLYNFRSGTTVYAYQSGFADESKNERPGYVSHALAMEYNAGQGCTRYDFLAGDNRLKRSFGEPYEMPSVAFGKPTIGLRTEAFLRSLRSHLSV